MLNYYHWSTITYCYSKRTLTVTITAENHVGNIYTVDIQLFTSAISHTAFFFMSNPPFSVNKFAIIHTPFCQTSIIYWDVEVQGMLHIFVTVGSVHLSKHLIINNLKTELKKKIPNIH